MNKFKSFNPSIAEHFKKIGLPKYQYGHKHIIRPQTCQDILNKLNLQQAYPNSSSNLTIVDVFSGYGLFSTMINYELKPKKHVIIEETKENVNLWEDRIKTLEEITGNKENFVLYPKNGYKWETFDHLIKDKVIEPTFVTREKVHDELLIVANLTPLKFGESLLAQWIMCSVYQNWLQKYGRVRMLCFTPDATAQKFLSGAHFPKRNKSAIKRELFTDTKLIAITESNETYAPEGSEYDPNILVKDQPVIIPSKSILPLGGQAALIEILPKQLPMIDFDMLEYIIQILMYRSTGKISEALSQLAPGAESDLASKIPKNILQKSPRDMSPEDIYLVFDVFDKWPFKPSFTDTIGIIQEDTRTF